VARHGRAFLESRAKVDREKLRNFVRFSSSLFGSAKGVCVIVHAAPGK